MCSRPQRAGKLAALTLLLITARVAAEPLHLLSAAQCTTEKGSIVRFDPGYYVPNTDWEKLDTEIKRLQTVETRLTAENQSYKNDSGMGWRSIIVTVSATIGGLVIGSRWL